MARTNIRGTQIADGALGVDLTVDVTGLLPVLNGGTGASTAATARSNLGLGNVDNVSDANKPVSTAQQTAIDNFKVPLRDLFRPMTEVISSAVLTTDTYNTSLPGDYVNYTTDRWDSALFNTQGQNLIAATAGNPSSGGINDANGRSQSGVPQGSIMDVEFIHTGDKLDVMLQTFGYFDMQVYIEDQGVMKKAKFLPMAGNYSGAIFRTLRFAEIGTRRIRLIMPTVIFFQLVRESNSILKRSPDRPLIVTTGDSYFESGGRLNVGSSRTFLTFNMIDKIIEMTGFAVARCGQGGTGYFNDGTGGTSVTPVGTTNTSPFFSVARSTKYGLFVGSTAKPVCFLINGTINDGALSGSGAANRTNMGVRALAAYQAITSTDPYCSILVIGPEPYNNSAASGDNATNRLGIMDAIAATTMTNNASISLADANNPTDPWYTGLGSEASPTTGSQQAAITGMDGIHPNWYGDTFYGTQIVNALANVTVGRARAQRLV